MVLGDFGRSPRMQYHALSLADQADFEVDVVAYLGSTPREEIVQHEHIHLRLIPPPPEWLNRYLPRVLALAVRVLTQLLQLLVLMLVRLPRPNFVLLQTPPCVPSFTVCRVVCFLRGAKFVIDWHNFAYTLMGLQMGIGHPLVEIARRYEKYMGRTADAHLCVTNAMQQWLEREWGIHNAQVVHDKPPAFFTGPLDVTQAHIFFLKIEKTLDSSNAKADDDLTIRDLFCFGDDDGFIENDKKGCSSNARSSHARIQEHATTPITTCLRDSDEGNKSSKNNNSLLNPPRWRNRNDRPCVLVSSTSWTPDEDFGVLLDALVRYDRRATEQLNSKRSDTKQSGKHSLPNLLVIVTGKGPQKEMYELKMRGLRLNRVVIRTAWLDIDDYPKILGSADLGVCLHTSSSGLDLPMKVVDMFGAGLPVVAARYDVIHELVVSDAKSKIRNGALFSNEKELCATLVQTLSGWGTRDIELDALRRGAAQAPNTRWEENWEQCALPVFQE